MGVVKKFGYYAYSIGELFSGFSEWSLILKIFTRRAGPGIKEISLRREGLRFKVRGAMDVWSIKETFLDRFYERFGMPVEDGWRVLDIGAGIGDFTIFAASGRPNTRVYAFEPFPASFDLLQQNLSLNQLTNATAFCEAVSGVNCQLELDLTSGEPLQFRSERQATRSDGELLLPTSRRTMTVAGYCLDDIFERLSLERCDLMKLDCEGAEYEILFQAPGQLFDRIDRMVMEYHDGVTSYNHQDLVEFLGEKGYRVRVFPNFVHPELGYLRAIRNHP